MHIYGATHLSNSFRTVRQNTIQIAEDIPESSYSFVPAEGTRSVAQTLMHLAAMPQMVVEVHQDKIVDMKDYDFMGAFMRLEAEENKPRTKAEILEALRSEGDRFASFLGGLSDEFLEETIVEMPGSPAKTRLESLMGMKEHEMHHRGQLMLVERLLGIVPHLTRKYADMDLAFQEYKKSKLEAEAKSA